MASTSKSWRQQVRMRAARHRHRFQHRRGKLLPLAHLKPGQKGVIASVKGNCKVTQRLADLGLTPEATIFMLKAAPFNGPVEVAVRGSKLAIGREIAENILVQAKGT